jgi:hypothetical protein
MSAALKETAEAFSEPFAVVDTFVSGFGRMDNLGDGIMRAVLTVNQPDIYGKPGNVERVVIMKLVCSERAMKRLAMSILGSLATRQSDEPDEKSLADLMAGATVQ